MFSVVPYSVNVNAPRKFAKWHGAVFCMFDEICAVLSAVALLITYVMLNYDERFQVLIWVMPVPIRWIVYVRLTVFVLVVVVDLFSQTRIFIINFTTMSEC